jgi:ATP-dependent DNA ligase I
MLFAELAAVSGRVAETASRSGKIEVLASCLRRLAPEEVECAVLFLSGETRPGRLGIGYAMIRDAQPAALADRPTLDLLDVDRALAGVAASQGAGSAAKRRRLLTQLFGGTTATEQDFLVRLLVGELRQGALEGLMSDAVAQATGLPAADVRRAAMLAGGLAPVARAALGDGAPGLRRFSVRLFQPVRPMLAQPAEDVADALAQFGAAALDWKLDGARVQVHKSGQDVGIFTRSLKEVTGAVPEIVESVRALPANEIILDGEALALKPDGSPRSFQETMRRFGRKSDVEAMRAALPLAAFFFDCLWLDGENFLDASARRRFSALSAALPPALLVPRLVTTDAAAAEQFFQDALAHGHEGVMAKSLESAYEAGSRGGQWLKVKRANTLDLVVLAAEWGHGRRSGWLSNLHLGARDPATGGFVMLGKTFKGMSDDMLAWQTQKLLQLEAARDAYTVHVRPELVVEIACNEIQASPQYPGGLALRFARVKHYRPDKRPQEADTIGTVRAIYARQLARQLPAGAARASGSS